MPLPGRKLPDRKMMDNAVGWDAQRSIECLKIDQLSLIKHWGIIEPRIILFLLFSY